MAEFAQPSKIIVITGNAEHENALKAVALGADDFCTKPIDIEMLKVVLNQIYKMHALETSNRQLQNQTDHDSTLFSMKGCRPPNF